MCNARVLLCEHWFFYYFFSLVRIAVAAIAIRMITALASAVVIMFVLVRFDMMPINSQIITRP